MSSTSCCNSIRWPVARNVATIVILSTLELKNIPYIDFLLELLASLFDISLKETKINKS